jgi:hypothetical protein
MFFIFGYDFVLVEKSCSYSTATENCTRKPSYSIFDESYFWRHIQFNNSCDEYFIFVFGNIVENRFTKNNDGSEGKSVIEVRNKKKEKEKERKIKEIKGEVFFVFLNQASPIVQ